MARGFTIHADRVSAMRVIADAIRAKTREFEKAKAAHPRKFAADKKKALALLAERQKKLRAAKTIADCNDWYEIGWKTRDGLFSSPPTLNVCVLKHALEMMQMDTRKTVTINTNSDLWAMLEGKCEVIRG